MSRKPSPRPGPEGLRVEYARLGAILTWDRNPKAHDLEALGKSMERFGFVSPVVVNEATGQLVAGHGRVEDLRRKREAGEPAPDNIRDAGDDWLVPVVRGVSFASASESEAAAFAVADNRLVEVGGWDNDLLAEVLGGFEPADLAGIGFEPADVDRVLSAAILEDHAGDRFAEEADAFERDHGATRTKADRAPWLWCEFDNEDDYQRVRALLGSRSTRRDLVTSRLLALVSFAERELAAGRLELPEV